MTKPFLKWAGGKRWLAPRIASLLQIKKGGRYVEPFLGSGAVFFAVRPAMAILADINEELILAFQAIQENPDYVIRSLSHRKINVTDFEKMRRSAPATSLDRAVRMLYLNRTAFNGLFRVNQQGFFNVPFGCKSGTKLCDPANIRAASIALQNATLSISDFRDTLRNIRRTDTVYVDPPYTVRHNNNGFRRYNEQIFSWQDQVELASLLNDLASNGVTVIVSNAVHHDVCKLYAPRLFRAVEVRRPSQMAANVKYRGPCKELLLFSTAVTSDLFE